MGRRDRSLGGGGPAAARRLRPPPVAPSRRRRRDVREGARSRRSALRAVSRRRLGARAGRAARGLVGVRRAGCRLRQGVGCGSDRHRDDARHARARDRLARAAPLRGGGPVVGAPSRHDRDRLPGVGFRRLGRAGRLVRRHLAGPADRDGARRVGTRVVVDSRRAGLRRHRRVLHVRDAVSRHHQAARRRRAFRGSARLRAPAGCGRDPDPRGGGERRHERGECVRHRARAEPPCDPLGHAPRRSLQRPRGAGGGRARDRTPLEPPPAEGAGVVRHVRTAGGVGPDARHAAPRRHGCARGGPAGALRRGGDHNSLRCRSRARSAARWRRKQTGRR